MTNNDKAIDALAQKQSETLKCQDWPDTHTWSNDYKEFDGGRTITRYCTKCGLDAISHTMRLL